jgi:hypothetical protein
MKADALGVNESIADIFAPGRDRTMDCVVIRVAATQAKTTTEIPVTTVPGLIPEDFFRRKAGPERELMLPKVSAANAMILLIQTTYAPRRLTKVSVPGRVICVRTPLCRLSESMPNYGNQFLYAGSILKIAL